MKICAYLAVVVSFASSFILAQDSAPPSPVTPLRQILETSRRRGQLEMPDAPPFHLKASFQLFNGDGKPAETGTVDELWRDTHHYRRAIKQPGGDLLEVNNDGQHWRTGNWSIQNRIILALNAALQPFYRLPAGDRLFVEPPPKGNPTLDCIGTEPDIPGVGMDVRIAETTYCMSKGSHLLRLILRPSGFSIDLNDTQPFEKKYIARSIDLPAGNGVLIGLHIDSLTTADNFDALSVTQPANAESLQDMDEDRLPFYEGGMLGQAIDTPMPHVPDSAGHGKVVLFLVIDTSGHVSSANLVSSPNQILGSIALGAVKNWRYRVAYQDDKLVPGSAQVTLVF